MTAQDITERLSRRATHDLVTEKCRNGTRALLREAMDEIRRLRDERDEARRGWDMSARQHVIQAERAERAEAERDALREWRDSVSNAIKSAPEFAAGAWGGDKEGWGYHFEVVRHLVRTNAALREVLGRLVDVLGKARFYPQGLAGGDPLMGIQREDVTAIRAAEEAARALLSPPTVAITEQDIDALLEATGHGRPHRTAS